MTVSRVLVGDDGSADAAAARTWAKALGRAVGASVVVATVAEDPDLAIDPEHQALEGTPAPALLAFADELAADLVVVGRRGSGGFPALPLGSTAHQLAEHARVPVAVVPRATVTPDDGWPFTTVAVGLDGTSISAGALTWVVPLAQGAAADVVVVHALELGPALALAGLTEQYDDARARVVASVEEWCAPLRDGGVRYSTAVEEGGAAGVLLAVIRARGADLAVVGRHTAGSFPGIAMGSAAHRVLGFAPCPTVVVPGT